MSVPYRIGPYRLIECIGQGTMGKVYRACDKNLSPVAVKLLAIDGTVVDHQWRDQNEAVYYLERFFKEIMILAELTRYRTGVPAYIDHGVAKNRVHYLAMELVQGKTLATQLQERRVDIGDALAICRDILHVLEYAHALGIVHRDLKPSNLMLGADGKVRVLDFGVARAFYSNTDPRYSVGNPQHMSPEQARGKEVTPASDIFAVGSILYTLLTGHHFFSGATVDEVMASRRRVRIAREPAIDCGLSPDLWSILYTSLQQVPEKRPSARLMRTRIEIQQRILTSRNSLSTSSVIPWDTTLPANDGDGAASETLVTQFK